MPTHRSSRRSGATHHGDRAVLLVVLSAVGAVLFTLAGGLLVYSNTQHLISIRDWVDHSQSVLTSLQTASQRLDRVESSSSVYFLTKDEERLNTAQSNAMLLSTVVQHLRELVKDNASQLVHADQLSVSVQRLDRTIDALTPHSAVPAREILDCRQKIAFMQEDERDVLSQRTVETRRSTYRNQVLGVGYMVLSLLVVIALFSLLLRDVLRRRQSEETISETNTQLELTIAELKVRARESVLLTAARDELQLCVTPSQAHQCAVRYCGQLLPGTRGALLIINNSRQTVELSAVWNDPISVVDGVPLSACCGLRSGSLRWRSPGQSEVHCSHFTGTPPENYLCAPLAAQGDTLGFLYVECPTAETCVIAAAHERSLIALIELTAMSVASLNLRVRLENQSIRDSLTGLFNRHFMEIALERELRRAARQQSSLAVLMLDVDHFKQFNDTYGHEAGDMILREVGETFLQVMRAEDVVCRYGGEEFVIILPDISTDAALDCAEMLRMKISEIRMRYRGESLREITISIGVAMYPQYAEGLDQILRISDHALYEAKHCGRNTVVLAGATSLSKATPLMT